MLKKVQVECPECVETSGVYVEVESEETTPEVPEAERVCGHPNCTKAFKKRTVA